MTISNNPLDYVTKADLFDLELTPEEIAESYQPSFGGVYHARGPESTGKTLWCVHKIRWLIDKGFYKPSDGVGNITLKGKYGKGFQTLKGDDLRTYLWDLTHKPYRDKFVIIDEIDSEFPARFHTDSDQTETALRMWHVAKLHNHIFMTSHIGKSADLIFHLASHYLVFPRKPDFATNTLDFTIANGIDLTLSDWEALDVIKTMLIYSRRELTEDTEAEQNKQRRKAKDNIVIPETGIDEALEWEKGLVW